MNRDGSNKINYKINCKDADNNSNTKYTRIIHGKCGISPNFQIAVRQRSYAIICPIKCWVLFLYPTYAPTQGEQFYDLLCRLGRAVFWRNPTVLTIIIAVFLSIPLNGSLPAWAAEQNTDNTPQKQQYDQDHMRWITVSHYNLFIDTDKQIDSYHFFLNGKEITAADVSAKKYKNSLHIRFKVQPGKNILIVKDGAEIYSNIAVYFAPSYASGSVPDEYRAVYFHTISNESRCIPCHRLAAKRSDVRPKDITKQICYPCHSHKFESLKVLHKPAAGQWRCLICHQYKALETDLSPDEPLKFMVNQDKGVARICFKCHQKKQNKIKHFKYVHGPIGMGACNLCHNPHGSQLKHLLQDKISNLCINCHDFSDKLKKQVVHKIIQTKGCTACHNPHGSMHKYQLIAGLNDLCYKCHPDIFKLRNNHPLQNHPVYAPAKPGDNEKALTCTSCHDPHSSKYKYLIPEPDTMMICAKCHNSLG